MKEKNYPHLENIADLLWLSQFTGMQSVAIEKIEDKENPEPKDKPKIEDNEVEENTKTPEPEIEEPQDDLEVHTDSQEKNSTSLKQKSAKAIKSPKKLVLDHYREWEKAFKFINLKTPSKNRYELDEEKTVENIASLKVFDLVFRRVEEKSFFLTLVIDQGKTMELWEELIKNFEQMLMTMGVFARVSLYYWGTTNQKPLLYVDKKLKREVSEKIIVTDGQRNLVWVMSDCIAPAWRSGEAFKSIERWSTKSFTSILQMFPKRMWMGTMLFKGEHIRLSSNSFNPLNKKLQIKPSIGQRDTLKIPIVSFDPYALQAWAKVVVNAKDNNISGIELEDLDFAPIATPPKREVTPEMRMERFYSQASYTAQRLAFYMSVLPVDLQVTRILQEEKLPQSNQAHVAEIFLGGLIERTKKNNGVYYDFYPKIREELNANISADESFEIMESMSDFVSSHLGIGFDFKALLADPNGAFEGEFALSEESLAYARLASGVLKRKGGRFYEVARGIDSEINKVKIGKIEQYQLKYNRFQNIPYINDNLKLYHKEAIETIMKGIINQNKRMVLSLESGAIRHIILLEVLNKLYKSNEFEQQKPKILFLSDEFHVLSQMGTTLEILKEESIFLTNRKFSRHPSIYFSAYRLIDEFYSKYNSDFFDFIIIDEIPNEKERIIQRYRWKKVLDYFSDSTFISFTRAYSSDMKKYFGEEQYRFFYSENLVFFSKKKIERAKENRLRKIARELEINKQKKELYASKQWNIISNSPKIDTLKAFIDNYPESVYSKEAKQKILEIESYLSSLSPIEQKLEELYEKEKNKSKSSLLFESIKKGLFDDEKYEALILLEQIMKNNRQWKEISRAKNIKKDKWYHRTLYVIKMKKENNNQK